MRKYKVPPVPASMWKNPLHFIAFGFGAGALPIAPGTFGTVVGVIFYLMLHSLSPLTYLVIVIVATLASMWICDKVSRDIQVDDHQAMCLDEVIGFLVTMLFVPFSWMAVILGFVLFRVFDIFKPWPIGYVDEKMHGGIGMILDDVLAGVYSCLVLHFSIRIVHML